MDKKIELKNGGIDIEESFKFNIINRNLIPKEDPMSKVNDFLSKKNKLNKNLELIKIFVRMVGKIRTDKSYSKVLDFDFIKLKNIISYSYINNKNYTIASEKYSLNNMHYDYKYVKREFNQQPCTNYCLSRKVEDLAALESKNNPILIIGDDDLLSVELEKNGFTDITVIDIDKDIISIINTKSKKIKTICQDLNNLSSEIVDRPYSSVILDPAYNIESIKLFINSALKMCSKQHEFKMFFSTCLLYLTESEFVELKNYLSINSIKVNKIIYGYNCYLPPKKYRLIYKLSCCIIYYLSGISIKNLIYLYNNVEHAFSDLLLCEREVQSKYEHAIAS